MNKKISYSRSVNYSVADPAKVLAQKEGRATAKNLPFGFFEVDGTRGESAYVFDMGNMYGALVQEGLGTKSLIAQAIYKNTGKSYFAAIAQDTVATFINDLISVGATPVAINAYWSSSSYDWLTDPKLTGDFIKGWRAACDYAQVTWGGGETQSLPDMVVDGALELAGSAFGVVNPKRHLVSEKKLQAGDSILLIESSGVHANGISLIRELAKKLKAGYQTKLPSGQTLGEATLVPTHIYAALINDLQGQGIDIHYLSNITGHGWRKLMRATVPFTYRLTQVPELAEIFDFIAKHSSNSEQQMYSNYNMGAGYAIFLAQKDVAKAQKIAKKHGLSSWIAGQVEKGPKQVVIEPRGITFSGHSLGLR